MLYPEPSFRSSAPGLRIKGTSLCQSDVDPPGKSEMLPSDYFNPSEQSL